jgi:hypothetical protein
MILFYYTTFCDQPKEQESTAMDLTRLDEERKPLYEGRMEEIKWIEPCRLFGGDEIGERFILI